MLERFVVLMVLLVVSGASSCAIGSKVEYRGLGTLRAAYSPDDMPVGLNVTVADMRDFVVSGGDDGSYVGRIHGFLPIIPWDIRTASGAPLAQDIGGTLVKSLRERGFDAAQLDVKAGKDKEVPRVIPQEGRLGLVFGMRKWHTATWLSTSLVYDVQLQVFDSTGNIVASASRQGDESIGSEGGWMSIGEAFSAVWSGLFVDARKAVLAAAKQNAKPTDAGRATSDGAKPLPARNGFVVRKQEEPPAQPATATAPTSPAPPPVADVSPTPRPVAAPTTAAKPKSEPAPQTKCSVEQVLKMKAMNLTDEQVQAACR